MDNLTESCPAWVLRFQFIQALMLSETLFHEIGHHIHATQVPEYKEREDVADEWGAKLHRKYFWKKYWYILVINYLLKPILRAIERILKKLVP